jgi:hypothetical protein
MMSYDLLWPVNTRLDAGMPEAKVVEEVGGTLKNGSSMFLWWWWLLVSLAYQTDEILFSGFTYFNG